MFAAEGRFSYADAASGLLDVRRVSEMLARVKGRITHNPLDHVSPLAVPVMLEIGRERDAVHDDAAVGRRCGSRIRCG